MIELIKVKDRREGNLEAHHVLLKLVDNHTLLALSGGSSPDYPTMIVKPADILPGGVFMVDERYGDPYHMGSNEYLIDMAGVVDFLDTKKIPVHKILIGTDIEKTAWHYNELVKKLFDAYGKRVGVMGVGPDLHTASIFPGSKVLKSKDYVDFDTVKNEFPHRITLTLKALETFFGFVILLFGQDKKRALEIMLDEGENDIEKYPAIFYRQTKVKSYLITDIQL